MVANKRSKDRVNMDKLALLAQEGREVHARVSIKKSDLLGQNSFSLRNGEKCFFESYVWSGEYVFNVDDAKDNTFSKVYLAAYFFGTEEERQEAERILCKVANQRLRADYRRLKNSYVELKETFFC